jgi:hypothetical protein
MPTTAAIQSEIRAMTTECDRAVGFSARRRRRT